MVEGLDTPLKACPSFAASPSLFSNGPLGLGRGATSPSTPRPVGSAASMKQQPPPHPTALHPTLNWPSRQVSAHSVRLPSADRRVELWTEPSCVEALAFWAPKLKPETARGRRHRDNRAAASVFTGILWSQT